MSDWYWLLILAAAYAWPRLLAHELSHAVATLCVGLDVYWKRFRPWPHKTEQGRWVWGQMYREDSPGPIDDLIISYAPLWRAELFALAWIGPALAWPPLWVCVAWELTDAIHWWVGWARWKKKPYTDGAKVRAIVAKMHADDAAVQRSLALVDKLMGGKEQSDG